LSGSLSNRGRSFFGSRSRSEAKPSGCRRPIRGIQSVVSNDFKGWRNALSRPRRASSAVSTSAWRLSAGCEKSASKAHCRLGRRRERSYSSLIVRRLERFACAPIALELALAPMTKRLACSGFRRVARSSAGANLFGVATFAQARVMPLAQSFGEGFASATGDPAAVHGGPIFGPWSSFATGINRRYAWLWICEVTQPPGN
jgi:hypothetical protein